MKFLLLFSNLLLLFSCDKTAKSYTFIENDSTKTKTEYYSSGEVKSLYKLIHNRIEDTAYHFSKSRQLMFATLWNDSIQSFNILKPKNQNEFDLYHTELVINYADTAQHKERFQASISFEDSTIHVEKMVFACYPNGFGFYQFGKPRTFKNECLELPVEDGSGILSFTAINDGEEEIFKKQVPGVGIIGVNIFGILIFEKVELEYWVKK
jgi:hypothetical protein